MDKEKYNVFLLKYDNLAQDCLFEEIPHTYKQEVIKSFASCFYPYNSTELSGTTDLHRSKERLLDPIIILCNIKR
jgi:hypothetical protein